MRWTVPKDTIDMGKVEKGDPKAIADYVSRINMQLEKSNQIVSDLVKINQILKNSGSTGKGAANASAEAKKAAQGEPGKAQRNR